MTAIEYGLICALVALAILAGVAKVGTGLSTTFCTIGSHLHAGQMATSCAQERKIP
jgi:Flp pilus assembly pilin Flp